MHITPRGSIERVRSSIEIIASIKSRVISSRTDSALAVMIMNRRLNSGSFSSSRVGIPASFDTAPSRNLLAPRPRA